MKILPIANNGFKGLWEVKTARIEKRGETNYTVKKALYHPFQKEKFEKNILEEVPKGYKSEDGRKIVLTQGAIGRRLPFTERDFYLRYAIPNGMCTTTGLKSEIINNSKDEMQAIEDEDEIKNLSGLFKISD